MEMEPHAVQVFHFNAENKLCLNDTIFEILNQQEITDKKVCVISIAGAFRQGKSFLQNFFIRYLNLKYKMKIKRMSHWLDPKYGSLSGFAFEGGSTRQTTGILMWSEIFLASLPKGEEVAIILMDTQGSFDNVTTLTDCGTIFALSVLISSVQIYNLKENIKQYDLQHLQYFVEYGQLALDSESRTPFQKLLFLIRDWQWQYEKKFGFNGGEQLLNEALNTEQDKPEELIELKNSIKKSFKDASCFLLPHPGKTVASSKSFQGNIKEIEADFRAQVEILVRAILAPENIVFKEVNSQAIRVKDLVDLMKAYSTCFKDGKLPQLKTLFSATAEVHHTVAMSKAVDEYKKEMENCTSQEEANNIKNQVLEMFRRTKKIGTRTTFSKYINLLEKELEELFSKVYERVIKKREKEGFWRGLKERVLHPFVNKGTIGGAITGTTVGAIAAGGAIISGATVAEIAVLTTVVGTTTGGLGFLVIGATVATVQGIRWLIGRKRKVVNKPPVVEEEIISEATNAVVEEFVSDTTECEVTDDGRTEVVQAFKQRKMVGVLSLEGSNEEFVLDSTECDATDDERTESQLEEIKRKQNPKQEGQVDVSFPNEVGIVGLVVCAIIVVIYNIVLLFLQW